MNRVIFSGMKILFEKKWVEGMALVVEESRIKAVIRNEMISHHLPAKQHEYPSDYYLVPGLIDLHVHGAAGCDVMDGSVESLCEISTALASEGVTGFLATTMTMDHAHIEAALRVVPEAMKKAAGAAILGVHLEGPFIAKDKMGAQSQEYVELPNIELMSKWQKIAGGHIKLVTLAPELPGAIPFIAHLRKMNVQASIGHTNATYEQTLAAIFAGCTQATHLFNAMSPLHQREPGAAAALLLSREVSAELIVDGVHVHPAMVELAWMMKGKDHLLLVTDAMRAKCMGDGCYDLGGQSVTVKEGRATLSNGVIAGSTLRMPKAIRNMDAFSRCSLIDAIQMATQNPAMVLGLSHRGTIEVGYAADVVVLNADFEVVQTLRGGETIYLG